jgi:hypothetical protein
MYSTLDTLFVTPYLGHRIFRPTLHQSDPYLTCSDLESFCPVFSMLFLQAIESDYTQQDGMPHGAVMLQRVTDVGSAISGSDLESSKSVVFEKQVRLQPICPPAFSQS